MNTMTWTAPALRRMDVASITLRNGGHHNGGHHFGIGRGRSAAHGRGDERDEHRGQCESPAGDHES